MLKLPWFGKRSQIKEPAHLGRSTRMTGAKLHRDRVGAPLKSNSSAITLPADYGFSERITLYRFLRENIPIISGAIWVWTRLCASPMVFISGANTRNSGTLKSQIDKLGSILAPNPYYRAGGLERLCDLFFSSLFVDGAFAGSLDIDQSGKFAGFTPCDIRALSFDRDSSSDAWKIYHETPGGRVLLDPATFIYIPLDDDVNDPRGKSILQSIGFVSRIEQKLLDDMQKSQEKAGYNRLHVQVKKPERRVGESENAYVERANSYFEDTVTLFSGIKPADSTVTWDDIEIKTVGPESGSGSTTNSWYLSHRALVEDICAGVHLDPYMLGYSYSSTQTWARFKYELVLREIISVQRLAIRFFEWLINTHLAAADHNLRVTVSFDNNRVNNILERFRSEHEAAERVLELFKAGLLSKDEARERILSAEAAQ